MSNRKDSRKVGLAPRTSKKHDKHPSSGARALHDLFKIANVETGSSSSRTSTTSDQRENRKEKPKKETFKHQPGEPEGEKGDKARIPAAAAIARHRHADSSNLSRETPEPAPTRLPPPPDRPEPVDDEDIDTVSVFSDVTVSDTTRFVTPPVDLLPYSIGGAALMSDTIPVPGYYESAAHVHVYIAAVIPWYRPDETSDRLVEPDFFPYRVDHSRHFSASVASHQVHDKYCLTSPFVFAPCARQAAAFNQTLAKYTDNLESTPRSYANFKLYLECLVQTAAVKQWRQLCDSGQANSYFTDFQYLEFVLDRWLQATLFWLKDTSYAPVADTIAAEFHTLVDQFVICSSTLPYIAHREVDDPNTLTNIVYSSINAPTGFLFASTMLHLALRDCYSISLTQPLPGRPRPLVATVPPPNDPITYRYPRRVLLDSSSVNFSSAPSVAASSRTDASSAALPPPLPPAPAAQPVLPLPPIAQQTHWLPYPRNTSYPSVAMIAASRQALATSAPTVPFTVTRGIPNHTHPVSHTLRTYHAYTVLDQVVQENAPGLVVDIGGKVSMWDYHPAARHIHCTRPIISPADLTRNYRPLQCCRCVYPSTCYLCDPTNATAAVSVHSIYYLSKDTVANLTHSAPFYAVLHQFDGFSGQIQELKWKRTNNTITAAAEGEPYAYEHDACDWVYSSNYYDNGIQPIAWTLRRLCAGTYLAKFIPAPSGLKSEKSVYPVFDDTTRLALEGLTDAGYDWQRVGCFVVYVPRKSVNLDTRLFNALVAWWPGKVASNKNLSDAAGKAANLAQSLEIPLASVNTLDIASLSMLASIQRYERTIDLLAMHDSRVLAYNDKVSRPELPLVSWWQRALNFYNDYPLITTAATAAIVSVVGAFYAKYKITSLLFRPLSPVGYAAVGIGRASASVAAALVLSTLVRYIPSRRRRSTWRQAINDTVASYRDTKQVPKAPRLLPLGPSPYVAVPSYCSRHDKCDKPQKKGSTVTCPDQTDNCRVSIGSMLTGVAFHGWTPIVPRSCSHNEYAAIVSRVTLATPIAEDPSSFALGTLTWPPTSHIDDAFNQWRDSLEGPKRRLYDSAFQQAPESLWRCARSELFVKRENNIKAHDSVYDGYGEQQHPAKMEPRAIQSSTPYSNYTLGPFFSSRLKAIERYLLDVNSDFIVIYSMSPDEAAEVVGKQIGCFTDPVFISADVSRADASTSAEFLTQDSILCKQLGASQDVTDLLDATVKIRGVSAHGVRYSAPAGTRSGNQNTTSNHVITGRYVWSSFKKGLTNPISAVCINKSDDNLIICERRDLEATLKYFEYSVSFGVNYTYTITDYLPAAEFLSLRFFQTSNGYQAVPKIGRTMSKLFWSVYPSKISEPLDHVATVCHGLRHLRDVPIFGKLIRRCSELSAGFKTDLDLGGDVRWKHNWKPTDYDNAAIREAYCRLYNTTNAEIDAAEAVIDQITQLPFVIHHPLFDTIIRTDLAMMPNPCDSFTTVVEAPYTPPTYAAAVPKPPTNTLRNLAISAAVAASTLLLSSTPMDVSYVYKPIAENYDRPTFGCVPMEKGAWWLARQLWKAFGDPPTRVWTLKDPLSLADLGEVVSHPDPFYYFSHLIPILGEEAVIHSANLIHHDFGVIIQTLITAWEIYYQAMTFPIAVMHTIKREIMHRCRLQYPKATLAFHIVHNSLIFFFHSAQKFPIAVKYLGFNFPGDSGYAEIAATWPRPSGWQLDDPKALGLRLSH